MKRSEKRKGRSRGRDGCYGRERSSACDVDDIDAIFAEP